ncbi:MAG TPA: hypothetical protein VF976_12345 [Gemmatimonadales bacterium]
MSGLANSRQVEVTLPGSGWVWLTHLLLASYKGSDLESTMGRPGARVMLLTLLQAAVVGATPLRDALLTESRAAVDAWLADHGGAATDAEQAFVTRLVRPL